MRRIVIALLSCLLAVAWLVVGAPAAQAAGAPITRMEIQARIGSDGLIQVTQTFDMRFSGSNDHGPYVFFTTRYEVPNDSSRWRVLRYTISQVSSPTGAPAQWKTEHRSGTLALRIGSPNRTVHGSHTYVVEYTVAGVVNPKVASSGLDEVFWNVIGTGFTVPISDVSVQFSSPTEVSHSQCWAGLKYDRPCTSHQHDGSTASYQQKMLYSGEGLAVVAGWPAGTFTAQPIYESRQASDGQLTLFPVTPLTVGGTGLLSVAAIGFFVVKGRRSRDQAYQGLAPGLRPAPGTKVPIGPAGKPLVAVQFTPPRGGGPGTLGTLLDKRADTQDVTATIVNLAVRGYLRIEQTGPSRKNFQLVRTADPVNLLPHEKAIFTDVFPGRTSVITSAQLSDRRFAATMKRGQAALYRAVTAAGFFVRDPSAARTRWLVIMVLAGVAAGLLAIWMPMGLGVWPAVPVGVFAAGAMIYYQHASPRTADGTAAYLQSLGFRQYLMTAEADQIRWEEGQDIFSRYLPYAIAFGCAAHWAAVFRELAARGVDLPQPSWYSNPYTFGDGSGFTFTDSLDSMMSSLTGFNESAAAALQAASVGSVGDSGFSSAGFSGGGGGGIGGGGGGSW